MIKIGMMIGDRYEILEKIGTGGMSDVYKAKCHKLNRFVAVKVLKQEFSENTNFVSKFRVEAQAAAGLMHPNIVNVYDVGEENGIYYIVMELVEGITLKNYIEKKARISVKEAISIAIQISMGIEAAHNNHIIHRDIKPQNIIISKEGKVKVTDFGIAKAATSNTITSNVMGSVHYTSPEQARGGYSDEKSDIYSLGITMFEMLTGRVPFNGDTTVSIAIKHIQEEMPSPREYIPEIPVSVEQIVLKCTQKSPDRRYQNIADVIEDLKKSLINPDADIVRVPDYDEEAGTKVISDSERSQIKRRAYADIDGEEEMMRLNQPRQRKNPPPVREPYQGGRQTKDAYVKNQPVKKAPKKRQRPVVQEIEDNYDEYDYNPKMDKITTVLAVLTAIIIGIIVIFVAGKAFGLFSFGGNTATEETAQIPMPAVVGKSVEEAKTILREAGLSDIEVTYEESADYAKDTVLRASVEEGVNVSTDTKITLTASSGKDGVAVPKVMELSMAEATAQLEKEGFVVLKTEVYSDTVIKGNVVSQAPAAGEKVPRGTEITLQVSIGPDASKIPVPDLLGMSEMDATILLNEQGILLGSIEEVADATYPAGTVCYQSYSVGAFVEPGASIDLKVSVGPTDVTYGFMESVASPAAEDPTYKEGTQTTVILYTAAGEEVSRRTENAFPIIFNITGIRGSSTGKLTFIYNVTTDPVTTVDEVTGETITIEGTTQQRIIDRNVVFTQQ